MKIVIFYDKHLPSYDTLNFMTFQRFPVFSARMVQMIGKILPEIYQFLSMRTVGRQLDFSVKDAVFHLCVPWFCLFIICNFQRGILLLCFSKFLVKSNSFKTLISSSCQNFHYSIDFSNIKSLKSLHYITFLVLYFTLEIKFNYYFLMIEISASEVIKKCCLTSCISERSLYITEIILTVKMNSNKFSFGN